MSHLVPLVTPPPPHLHHPGRHFSAAGSAGDTRQRLDPLSARSSRPETTGEAQTKEKCVSEMGFDSRLSGNAASEGYKNGENRQRRK